MFHTPSSEQLSFTAVKMWNVFDSSLVCVHLVINKTQNTATTLFHVAQHQLRPNCSSWCQSFSSRMSVRQKTTTSDITSVQQVLSGDHRDLPDSYQFVGVSGKQSLAIGRPRQRQTDRCLCGTAHHLWLQLINYYLTFQILQCINTQNITAGKMSYPFDIRKILPEAVARKFVQFNILRADITLKQKYSPQSTLTQLLFVPGPLSIWTLSMDGQKNPHYHLQHHSLGPSFRTNCHDKPFMKQGLTECTHTISNKTN